jgi:hypothetical protein
MFEFLIATTADLSRVTPQALIALDREPLNALLDAIKKETREIPAMDPGPLRDERFTDVTSKILSDWRADRRNLSTSWRTFFGGGLSSEAESFFKKGVDGATSAIGAGVVGDATYHAISGQFEEALFAAAGSLIVGLATRAIGARRRRRDDQARSPYRYLTLLEQNGVVFRSAETADAE